MNTLTQLRPPVKSNPPPVHGACRWLHAPGCFTCGPNAGVLLVNDARYVVRLCRENGARAGLILGATLTKNDGTMYTVDLSTGECDCPDHQYRGRECKHHKALVAGLHRIGETV